MVSFQVIVVGLLSTLTAAQTTTRPTTTTTATTLRTSITSTTSSRSTATPSSSACPYTLAGAQFQFPHLIVSSINGGRTSNTLYSPVINPSTTTYFNFDIPASYAGKTCTVGFALPRQDQLQTSSFTLGGTGNLTFSNTNVSGQSAAAPAKLVTLGSYNPVPGTAFTIASGPCAAGKTIAYSIAAQGNRTLTYFQDYNPCPIGLYVIAL